MSEKDKIIQLLDYVPEYKLGYVQLMFRGLLRMKIQMMSIVESFMKNI